MGFFDTFSFYSADILINLVHYYFEVVGNYTKAMLFFRKISNLKLSLEEWISYKRLYFLISNSLVEKLKSSFEGCTVIESLNTKLYFKYENLSKILYNEITNNVIENVNFWKVLKDNNENNKLIDLNKIFDLSKFITLL